MKRLFLMIICAAVLSSCASNIRQSDAESSKTVYAMDTVMTLKAYGSNAENALNEAEKEIIRLDNNLRRKSPDSEIYKINEETEAEVSEETADLIRQAVDICSSTDGAFDISIAPVMDLWGFYTKEFYVPSEEELNNELLKVNFNNICADKNKISLKGGSQLDLGGIAKGYLSEKIMEIFKTRGVKSGIVSLGGNVQTLGKKPDGSLWNVAIQNPDDDTYIGVAAVSDKAVVTSGGYQRFFEQDGVIYHHIIDPQTGRPAKSGVKSVSVVSADGTLADGLSTALFVMGLSEGTEYWRSHDGFDVIFVTDDNYIYITQGLEGAFTSHYDYNVITK